jgi:hypothetical protein
MQRGCRRLTDSKCKRVTTCHGSVRSLRAHACLPCICPPSATVAIISAISSRTPSKLFPPSQAPRMEAREHQRLSTLIRQILSKSQEDTVISYAGTSQYSVGGTGTAACGLAAMNFARVVFDKEQQRTTSSDPLVFLTNVLSRQTTEVADPSMHFSPLTLDTNYL